MKSKQSEMLLPKPEAQPKTLDFVPQSATLATTKPILDLILK